MTSPRDMPGYWRVQAAAIARYEAPGSPTVAALERCAAEMAASFAEADDALLTLPEAAAESGYSADHLGREIRTGRIPNAGRERHPRIRRGDLPCKPPPRFADSGTGSYDPGADARSLTGRLHPHGGAHGSTT